MKNTKQLEYSLIAISNTIRSTSKSKDATTYLKTGITFLFLKRIFDLKEEYALTTTFKNRDQHKIFETTEGFYSINWNDILKIENKIEFFSNFINSLNKSEALNKVFKVIDIYNVLNANEASIDIICNELSKLSLSFKDAPSDIFSEAYMFFVSSNANTITEYKENIGKHKGTIDYIVANPPFGLKDYGYMMALASKEERWDLGVPSKKDGDYAFLLTIIDLLNKNGKAAVVLPLGSLFKDTTKKIRKKLIELDLIEGIVSLPSSLFQTTTIPVCVWFLNKNKVHANRIFMINSSEDFVKNGKMNEWHHEKALKNYTNKIEEEGFSSFVENETILEADANLSIQRYILKIEQEEVIDIYALNEEIKELNEKIKLHKQGLDHIFEKILK